ncbi:MAG: hypothetical protein KGI67_11325 [Pseudomonadota bacterium]|nr:hypothetical protein [Pseudomonadota bacterium]
MSREKTDTSPPLELRDACMPAAQAVIAERGIGNLSLRAVARKPELLADATHAFDMLRSVPRRLPGDAPARRERVELDALRSSFPAMEGFIRNYGLTIIIQNP